MGSAVQERSCPLFEVRLSPERRRRRWNYPVRARGRGGTGRRAGFRSRWGVSPLEVRFLSPASAFASLAGAGLGRLARRSASGPLVRLVAVVEEDGVAVGVAEPGPMADAGVPHLI